MALPPDAEVAVSITGVRRLVTDLDPTLAELTLQHIGSGWDNDLYRLGDELAVRLPRRSASAPLLRHEQRWLPELASQISAPIPAPLHCGKPGHGFPWHWSIVPWIPGTPLAEHSTTPAAVISDLAQFIREMHQTAPSDAPANAVRGIALGERSETTLSFLGQLDLEQNQMSRFREIWAAACSIPPWPHEPQWLHGDLHPLNILVDDDRLSGVIDFGDITSGDPATDLAVAWMLPGDFEPAAFRHAVGGIDDDSWERARGWALSLAITFRHFSEPGMALSSIGDRVLNRMLA